MERKREIWIDYLKALCVFCMVLSHAGFKCFGSGDIIGSFHMPALFVASGFLYRPRPTRRIVGSFLIPILCFSALNLLWIVCHHLSDPHFSLLSTLGKFWQPLFVSNHGAYITPHTGVWFLIVLMLIRLLCGDIALLQHWTRRYGIGVMCILTLALSILPKESLHTLNDYHLFKVLECLPFFLAGMVLKEHKERWLNQPIWGIAATFALWIALTAIQGNTGIYSGEFGIGYGLFFLNAIVASLFFANAFAHLRTNRHVTTYSNGTLLVLGTHYLMIQGMKELLPLLHITLTGSVIFPLTATILTTIILIPAIRWCQSHAPFLLGK